MSGYLIHIGTKNSGRYPRGSGERPHQHDSLQKRKDKYVKRINEHISINKQLKRKHDSNTKSEEYLSKRYNVDKKDKTNMAIAKTMEEFYSGQFSKSNKIWKTAISDINKVQNKRAIKLVYKNAKRKVPVFIPSDNTEVWEDVYANRV